MLTEARRAALDALFWPRRVAVIGASERGGSTGAVVWENLSGLAGEVFPVNATGRPVGGVASCRSVLDIGADVDLAVIAVPAESVAAVAREAASKGTKACVVISGGFAESGAAGRLRQEELRQIARSSGMCVIGPNCFGVQNTAHGLNASISPAGAGGAGSISLVTQSGAYGMALHALARDEQMAFDKVVATGNKVDVGDAELLGYLARDGDGPICFFLESLPDGRAFVEAAHEVSARRPVIVCRTGASSAGRRAARSHTASLSGHARVWSAAFAEAGVIETHSGLEMLEVARALEHRRPPRGHRVASVTNSGGVGVELTDLLVAEGLEVPRLSATLRASLETLLPAHGSAHNPVDVTPSWHRFPELYGGALEHVARSGEVDSVVAVLLHRSATRLVSQALVDTVERLRREGIDVPLFVSWIGERDSYREGDPLRAAGVPVFEWPERTARALGHVVRHGCGSSARPDCEGIDAPAQGRAGDASGWMPVDDAARLLATHQVPLVRWALGDSAESVVERTADFERPVVLKAIHPDLLHKTDAGGVELGLETAEQIRAAARRLLGLRDGVQLLAQEQEEGLEMIVGGIRDAEFGPVVMVGAGGIHVESADDVHLALAPVTRERAGEMIGRLRGAVGRAGGRGRRVDVEGLAGIVAALSNMLAERREVAEVDLNPVFVRPQGCVVVDWRIRVDEAATAAT